MSLTEDAKKLQQRRATLKVSFASPGSSEKYSRACSICSSPSSSESITIGFLVSIPLFLYFSGQGALTWACLWHGMTLPGRHTGGPWVLGKWTRISFLRRKLSTAMMEGSIVVLATTGTLWLWTWPVIRYTVVGCPFSPCIFMLVVFASIFELVSALLLLSVRSKITTSGLVGEGVGFVRELLIGCSELVTIDADIVDCVWIDVLPTVETDSVSMTIRDDWVGGEAVDAGLGGITGDVAADIKSKDPCKFEFHHHVWHSTLFQISNFNMVLKCTLWHFDCVASSIYC